jgi:ubiquinone/menaquinone biosynthesis C-methylase UbiE
MAIALINPKNKLALVANENGLVDKEGNLFPYINGAYRMTSVDNYTANFGFQWNKFAKTQIDRFQKQSIQSYERFFSVTGWDKEDLTNKNVLEVGSGAGRFTQIVLQHTNANLFSVDYSDAVETNFRNNGPHPRLKLFQASIYELPFEEQQFDKVFCFGVLQHTPDFKRSVEELIRMVKPGGELVVDFYPVKGWYTKVHAKYIFRPFTKRLDHARLLSLIESNVDGLIKTYNFFDKIGVGRLVNRFLPVCDIRTTIPPQLSGAVLKEWVVLDTFDMFSPAHDHPQRLQTVVNWFQEFGMKNVRGEVVAFGNENKASVVKGSG